MELEGPQTEIVGPKGATQTHGRGRPDIMELAKQLIHDRGRPEHVLGHSLYRFAVNVGIEIHMKAPNWHGPDPKSRARF